MSLHRKPFEPSYIALVLLSNPMAAARWEHLMGLSNEHIDFAWINQNQ